MTRLLLIFLLVTSQQAAAQTVTSYSQMAPLSDYLMADRNAEIALARSAAPASISGNATVLVLGRTGFETAVEGSNGFVCLVERGWNGPFGWPELWSPKIRAAACLNPQAARSILPISLLRAKLVLAGRSQADIVSALKDAYAKQQLPPLEDGAMTYMLAKDAYLTDEGGHNLPHLMFYTRLQNGSDWGSGMEGAPVLSSPYWYFTPEAEKEVSGLPQLLVFLVALNNWSDGTTVY